MRMMNYGPISLVILTVVGIYVGVLIQRPVSILCESEKCPFCYGTDLCSNIERINLRYRSFTDLFYNLFSVKNVYFADYDGAPVVLKKLGHRSELNVRRIDRVTEDAILESIEIRSGSLKSCSREVAETLLESSKSSFELEHMWTILQVNVEPLMLNLFRGGSWQVPKLYGTCGFVIVEEYCGLPLDHFRNSPWHDRAFLAKQLLEAAIDFTHKHDDFRVYLTDISPDNIAVGDDLTVFFVDLENVILKLNEDNRTVHYSEYFPDEEFIYREEEVCGSSVSDHNVYSVCRLLLSRRSPWPMMPNGLLHSTPSRPVPSYDEIVGLVEDCVDSGKSRFYIAERLIMLLKEVNE